MPSHEPIPTIQEFLDAFHTAVRAERRVADENEGALYDVAGGVGAVLWRRMAERDRDEFRRTYFDTAPDDRLDEYLLRRLGKSRVQATRGTGTASLVRPSAAAGDGTFRLGTRIYASRGTGDAPRLYSVSVDTPVGASDVAATVPVEAGTVGPDGQLSASSSEVQLWLGDPVWDATWAVKSIACGPGTAREENDAVRARVRDEQVDERIGFPTALERAMRDAGAEVVALFPSDFLGAGLDFGLNRIYVGDAAYESSPTLLRACRYVLYRHGIAGAAIQVLRMTTALLTVTATVRLWDAPERFDLVSAQADAAAAIVEYFRARENPFVWRLSGVRGAIYRAVPNVQAIEITTSSPEPVLASLFNTHPLPRYVVEPWGVNVTLEAPS